MRDHSERSPPEEQGPQSAGVLPGGGDHRARRSPEWQGPQPAAFPWRREPGERVSSWRRRDHSGRSPPGQEDRREGLLPEEAGPQVAGSPTPRGSEPPHPGLRDTRRSRTSGPPEGHSAEGAPSGAPDSPGSGPPSGPPGSRALECPSVRPTAAGCFTFPLNYHTHLDDGCAGPGARQHPPGTHRPSAASPSTPAQRHADRGRVPPVPSGPLHRRWVPLAPGAGLEAYTPVPQPPISSAPPPNPFPPPVHSQPLSHPSPRGLLVPPPSRPHPQPSTSAPPQGSSPRSAHVRRRSPIALLE